MLLQNYVITEEIKETKDGDKVVYVQSPLDANSIWKGLQSDCGGSIKRIR